MGIEGKPIVKKNEIVNVTMKMYEIDGMITCEEKVDFRRKDVKKLFDLGLNYLKSTMLEDLIER